VICAVVPARGGSKGLPRKNLRPLNGRPLLAYAVDAGLGARLVDRVIVTTDFD
jgi:CMP-N-acetylneuraminic acid synthetase